MATKNIGEKCLESKSCRAGFCSPATGLCANPSLFQRCNAEALNDPCPSSQICDRITFRCLPTSSVPKNKGGVGARCRDVSECGARMACISGTCTFTRDAGEECDEAVGSKSGPQCKDGTVCFKGTCRDACYTIYGKDNPDWKCKNSALKCFATGRGVQGLCMAARPVDGPEPVAPISEPSKPSPITEPTPHQTPTPAPMKVKPWYRDTHVQIWFGVAAFLIFVLILATSITICCVKRKNKKQKSSDVEGKNPSIPLESAIIASAPIAPLQHVTPSSSGMMAAPAMGPELPPSYQDVASTESSLGVRMHSSTSLRSEKSEKQGGSVAHQTVPTAPESDEEGRQDVLSLPPPPRTPSRPPGSF